MELNLQSLLKTLKLNESVISMFLGVIIVFVGGILLYRSISSVNIQKTDLQPEGRVTQEAAQTGEGESGFVDVSSITSDGVKADTNRSGKNTVVSGDTLWEIAESQLGDGFAVKKIAEANSITSPTSLTIGAELSLPQVGTPDKGATINASNLEPIRGASYTVVHGDTLWEIAVRAYGDGYRWVDIAAENNLTNPNLIHRGNVFAIPR